jgi:outer membrane receptor protein involved in Fe transport
MAATFRLQNKLQLKTSFENAYRLPDGSEIFGNGLNVISNPTLKPEHSINFNGGFRFHKIAGDNRWSLEANYFYRDAQNLIRLAATGAKSEYVNLAKANIQGVESEIKFRKNRKFYITLNGTYQNLVNKTKLDENGKPNHTYMDRLPNTPYFFGNIISGYQIHDLGHANDKLEFSWYSRYVHEYYLQWPGHGEFKPSIPTQFTHNLQCDYSWNQRRYNVSLSIRNLFDSKAYDNYRVQKPGRAVYLKLRYFIK